MKDDLYVTANFYISIGYNRMLQFPLLRDDYHSYNMLCLSFKQTYVHSYNISFFAKIVIYFNNILHY